MELVKVSWHVCHFDKLKHTHTHTHTHDYFTRVGSSIFMRARLLYQDLIIRVGTHYQGSLQLGARCAGYRLKVQVTLEWSNTRHCHSMRVCTFHECFHHVLLHPYEQYEASPDICLDPVRFHRVWPAPDFLYLPFVQCPSTE
jgi:hypothetical protein